MQVIARSHRMLAAARSVGSTFDGRDAASLHLCQLDDDFVFTGLRRAESRRVRVALAVAVELVATILKQRAPGMSLGRMPLFVWAILVVALMVIFSMPAIALAPHATPIDELARLRAAIGASCPRVFIKRDDLLSFALGNALESYTMERSRRSIRALMRIAPATAPVLREGWELVLPVGQTGEHAAPAVGAH